jgi:hypothetical protein
MIPVTEPEHTRWHCYQKADALLAAAIGTGWKFTYQGQECTYDTGDSALFKLTVAYNTAQKYKAAGAPYQQAMNMRDYVVVVMDRDSIIEQYDAMMAFGLTAYTQYTDTISALNAMNLEQLQAWLEEN